MLLKPKPKQTKIPVGYLFGYDLSDYFGLVFWPVIVAGVLLINFLYFLKSPLLVLAYWLVNLAVFVTVGFIVRRKRFNLKQAGTAGILAGLVIGGLMAVLRIIQNYEFYLIFKLITEPMTVGFAGLVIVTIINYFFKKGGEENGGSR